jgi:putative methyltransferase (TIGR04325 family)
LTFFRNFVRESIPPYLFRIGGQLSGLSLRFEDVSTDWKTTQQRSGGYDESEILRRVVNATREVVGRRACYERDSVLFHEPQAPWQILAPLMRHALRFPGPLHVIDFGGSLGSTYRQCRPYLPADLVLNWTVIEQPSFVEIGQFEFSNTELSFCHSIEDMPDSTQPRLLLASSVLQYLPSPDSILSAWNSSGANTLLIDRTPVVNSDSGHLLTIQHIPRHIYKASYNCWLLSRQELLAQLETDWRLVIDFACPEGVRRTTRGTPFEFRGFLLERG